MAKRYTGKYTGAAWPLLDYQTDVFDLRAAFDAHAALQGSLRNEYARAAQAIRDNPDLSDVGRAKELAKVAGRFREHATVKQMHASLDTMAKREKELREKLTSRPTVDHDKLSPYAAGRLLATEADIRRRYESAEPAAQREQLRNALDRNDVEFVRIILDARLLDARTTKRLEAALLKQGDADALREWQYLVGKLDVDGVPDALSGALPVCGQTLALYLEHLDQAIGVDPSVAKTAAIVAAGTKDDAVTLDVEAAHNPQIFRAARDRAQEKGVPLRIQGDEGSGEVSPGELAPVTANSTAE